MRRLAAATVGILLVWANAYGTALTVNGGPNSVETNFITSHEMEITISIGELMATEKVDGYELQLTDDFMFGKGLIPGPDRTLLPSYSTLMAVPENAALSVFIDANDFVEFENYELAKTGDDDLIPLAPIEETEGFYPKELATFEHVGKMRDLYLGRLVIKPVQYDQDTKTLRVYHTLRIKADYGNDNVLAGDGYISEAFYPIYATVLSNIELINDVQRRRGAYWIIVPSTYRSGIQPFADWQQAQGFAVRVIETSEIGSYPNYSQIKTFIVAEYNAAEIKPDYICLVGDVNVSNGVDTWSQQDPYGFGTIDSDNYYSFIEGNDYFPELFVGRISISQTNDLTNYLNKYNQYSRTPYLDDRDWYLKGVMVAGSNYQSPRLTKLWCREMLVNHGYTQVDTFLTGWDSPTTINARINEGRTWVNYRGYGAPSGWTSPYYTTSSVFQLTNGPRYGIMTSIVCGTGDYNNGYECLGEAWIRYANRGGPGFIGTTNPDTHTQWNNAIDCGIYWGMMEEKVNRLAQLQLVGKMNMYYAFPADTYPGGRIEWYFKSYNDLGDPSLSCWSAVPEEMQVYHVDSISVGANGVSVSVTNNSGTPLENAYVCLWSGDDIFEGAFTNAGGQAIFQIAPSTNDTIAVTVTMANCVPYEGTIIVSNAEVAMGVAACIIDDDSEGNSSGNGDGVANPMEIIEMNPSLKNFGISQTAENVTAQLASNNPYIEVTTSQANYGNIAPGDSSYAQAPFVVSVGAAAPDVYEAELMLTISDDAGNAWQNFMYLPIAAIDLEVISTTIQNDGNGNGVIDRGEAGELALELSNIGSIGGQSIQAVLRTSDSLITITDSLGSFGDIDSGGSGGNVADPFALSTDPLVYNGHYANFELEITCGSGQMQTVEFTQMVGTVMASDPIGPDEYGYYCFDNTDTAYDYHPTFEWINIESSWDVVTVPDDYIYGRNLPFTVTYYGQTYSTIAISDNGYITMGQSWWSDFLNTNIPSPQCAPAMLAPFWDDLSNNGGPVPVRYHHDEANGMFIVGYQNVRSNDTYGYQDFEIIILDTEMWPTRTGDNDIIFQYDRVTSPYSVSVGICDRVRADGIQYLFNNHYTDGAPNLTAGRAIKFTTGSEYMVGIGDVTDNLPSEFSLDQNYPNPFNPTTNISYRLPEPGDVILEIYDVLGRRVDKLVDTQQAAGNYTVTWNARNSEGQKVSAGVYFYSLQAGDNRIVKKMLLLK